MTLNVTATIRIVPGVGKTWDRIFREFPTVREIEWMGTKDECLNLAVIHESGNKQTISELSNLSSLKRELLRIAFVSK